ncbi:MAG: hypothetical protein WBD09_03565 [Halobacteriota archaeon]
MKIGMMSLWNAANGPSIHAEFIGREWIKRGHSLVLFSARKHPDFRPTQQEDEDFVFRHFDVNEIFPTTKADSFNHTPLLEEDYEVFVAQNVERLPTKELLDVFPKIREKAITVLVVHEGFPPKDPLFYKFNWDAIVCFDQRYRDFLVRFFPKEIIHIIPYPCHPLKPGDKKEARRKLGLPLDDKIVFSFGFSLEEIKEVLPALGVLKKEHLFKYLIIANPESKLEHRELRKWQEKYDFMDVGIKALSLDALYDYLHACDVLLIPKESSKHRAVISSTVCQTLGSGCPILFHDSNYVELHGNEIVKYRGLDDMKLKLADLFDGKFDIEKTKSYLRENNASRVADRFIQLFEKVREERRSGSKRIW